MSQSRYHLDFAILHIFYLNMASRTASPALLRPNRAQHTRSIYAQQGVFFFSRICPNLFFLLVRLNAPGPFVASRPRALSATNYKGRPCDTKHGQRADRGHFSHTAAIFWGGTSTLRSRAQHAIRTPPLSSFAFVRAPSCTTWVRSIARA